ncbi:hypothetical protein [Salinisphaera orenii]|uniref:Uncharacterized protein n=1 Tax=Salinisphaera orenii YIM 95161 TaxID=1051139 RepID=A0A423PDF9_9GAMM|nr:hypothetical protein [Salinisphaera halophila]ROO23126.1 hypothetical protein SAHL_17140 [Salinisphaera halophila YIM 95161]
MKMFATIPLMLLAVLFTNIAAAAQQTGPGRMGDDGMTGGSMMQCGMMGGPMMIAWMLFALLVLVLLVLAILGLIKYLRSERH